MRVLDPHLRNHLYISKKRLDKKWSSCTRRMYSSLHLRLQREFRQYESLEYRVWFSKSRSLWFLTTNKRTICLFHPKGQSKLLREFQSLYSLKQQTHFLNQVTSSIFVKTGKTIKVLHWRNR